MVKYTVWNDYRGQNCEVTKFTRELNTYGVDENRVGEELLFPIRFNDESGGNQETNLATYLIKFKEFKKTDVKITNVRDKEGFFLIQTPIREFLILKYIKIHPHQRIKKFSFFLIKSGHANFLHTAEDSLNLNI